MKILLTGASGYLGTHVLERLRQSGLEVVLLGRSRPRGAEALHFIEADLLGDDDLTPRLREVGVTHLLHLAWYAEYGKYWTSPLNMRWLDASLRLLQAFGDSGGRHVAMAGTCAEYDWHHGYLREDTTPLAPASLYGVAKDATRRMATALCAARGMTLAWGHVFFPFGPGEARQRMLPSLIEVFRGRAAPFGVNTTAYRGMLPVADAAQALVHLLLHGCDGRYNICSGQPALLGDVVSHLAQLCGADPNPVLNLATARPDDPQMLVGDNTRLLATGWRPLQTLEQGLAIQVQQQP